MNANLPPILDFSRSDPNRGTLFDVRDGQSYPVVKIGNQIWLAENFRYLPSLEKDNLYDTSITPNGYLEKGYGRLYDWNTAISMAPEGWHLPSIDDFQELRDFIIKDNNLDNNLRWPLLSRSSISISKYLISKSKNTYMGNDKYGFNAKPASYINLKQGINPQNIDYEANFWAWEWTIPVFVELLNVNSLFAEKEFEPRKGDPISHRFSVRLIKNQ